MREKERPVNSAVGRGQKGGRMLAMNLKSQLSTEFRMQNYDRADF